MSARRRAYATSAAPMGSGMQYVAGSDGQREHGRLSGEGLGTPGRGRYRRSRRPGGRIIASFPPGRFEPVAVSQADEAGVVRRIGGPISAAAIPDMASANAERSRPAR
jgi:hypothetical protein